MPRQEDLKKMKDALVKERKRLEEQVTWDLIASKSPELAAMLDAFRVLFVVFPLLLLIFVLCV